MYALRIVIGYSRVLMSSVYFMTAGRDKVGFSVVGADKAGNPLYIKGRGARMGRAPYLDESPDLDTGNPAELGWEYAELKSRLRQLNVMGGCCGTDERHIERIATACLPLFP
jgi:hypothetical protein